MPVAELPAEEVQGGMPAKKTKKTSNLQRPADAAVADRAQGLDGVTNGHSFAHVEPTQVNPVTSCL